MRIKHFSFGDDPLEFDTEAEVEAALIEHFQRQGYTVASQVKKFSEGKCHIIDLIVSIPNSNVKIGIEIKKLQRFKGIDIAALCLQAQRYSKVFKIPVAVYPPISENFFKEGDHVHSHGEDIHKGHNVNTFLFAAFGIGEYHLEKKTFAFNGLGMTGKVYNSNRSDFEYFKKRYVKLFARKYPIISNEFYKPIQV